MNARRYLVTLGAGIVLWISLALGLVWLIDPYGTTPVRIALPGFNEVKPKRLDIDRIIKPYEVWLRRPTTVFLGTSRIHQAFDPSALKGTTFWPAYNASVPASTLEENAEFLRQFILTNGTLRHVVAELFLYNFIQPNVRPPHRSILDVAQAALNLNFSGSALFDALQTVGANMKGNYASAQIDVLGRWHPPVVPYTKASFDAYAESIARIHRTIPTMTLQDSAFAALGRLVTLCKDNGISLHLVVTPSHPYDDYRLLSLGYWPLLAAWYEKISMYENVIVMDGYNHMLEEPISDQMTFWYDPIHFSVRFGDAILRDLGGASRDPGEQIMAPLTPTTHRALLVRREQGLRLWMTRNPGFVNLFEQSKRFTPQP